MDAGRIEAGLEAARGAALPAVAEGGDIAAKVQQLARSGDESAMRQFLQQQPEQKNALYAALVKTDPGMIHRLDAAPALSDRLGSLQHSLDDMSGRGAIDAADHWASGAINSIRSDTPGLSQGASVLRGVLGFGKDLLAGGASLAQKTSPMGMLSSMVGDARTAAQLAEGRTTPGQLAQQDWNTLKAIPGAMARPVTDAWKRGDYVEAGTRGVLEVGSLLLPFADAGKAAEAGRAAETVRTVETTRTAETARIAETARTAETARPASAARAADGAATAQRKVIGFEPGGKGGWNSEVNRTLEKNTQYVDRDTGYKYLTDSQGRVSEAEGKLVLKSGERNGYQQSHVGGADRLPTDDGGHLFATIFKGPGERINLLPMDSNLNRGAWKAMENSWSEALGQGKQVSVQIKPHYDGSSLRPDRFEVRYTIGNGRPQYETFLNRPGGK